LADTFTQQQRSALMSRVRNRNTAPEMTVRKLLHAMGYRFRLHRSDLPGSPDIVLARHRKVIFVHGCFWHGHDRCVRGRRPTSNTEFWDAKIYRNIERDRLARESLIQSDWIVLTIWQCETKNLEELKIQLGTFLSGVGSSLASIYVSFISIDLATRLFFQPVVQ